MQDEKKENDVEFYKSTINNLLQQLSESRAHVQTANKKSERLLKKLAKLELSFRNHESCYEVYVRYHMRMLIALKEKEPSLEEIRFATQNVDIGGGPLRLEDYSIFLEDDQEQEEI